MAANTDKMRLGTCVTNPAVRDVHRFCQLVRHPQPGFWWAHGTRHRPAATAPVACWARSPTTLETLEEFVRIFRNLKRRQKTVDLHGVPTKITLDPLAKFPALWVAGLRPEGPAAPPAASATA